MIAALPKNDVALSDKTIEQMVAGFHTGPDVIAELERRQREHWNSCGRRSNDHDITEAAKQQYRNAILRHASQCLRQLSEEAEQLDDAIHTARQESKSLLMYPLITSALTRCKRMHDWLMETRCALHNANKHGRGRDDLDIALSLMTAAGDALEHVDGCAELLRDIREHETRCKGSVIGGGGC